MGPTLELLRSNTEPYWLRVGTWLLINLFRGPPQPDFETVRPSLSILSHLISSSDERVLKNVCMAFAYLSNGPNEKVLALIEPGVCKQLVELLSHSSPGVHLQALRTVKNIACCMIHSKRSIIIDNDPRSRLSELKSSLELEGDIFFRSIVSTFR